MKRTILTLAVACLMASMGYAQSAKEVKHTYQQLSVFEDPLALTLKKGTSKKIINKIEDEHIRKHALNVLAGNYKSDYKLADYHAILSPTTLGHQLSIGDGYSKYQNITGVYLPVGKHIVLAEGIERGKDIKLIVPNWLRQAPDPKEPTKDPKGWGIEKEVFELQNGVNIIDLKDFGSLAYIYYFSENPKEEKPIRVHFLTGQVNGYFDSQKQNNADWDKLLDKAVYGVVDAKGKYIQTAYPVADLKKYAGGKGVELINNYDSLVHRQHRIMGLIKYNRVPENKILSRVNYNYYMFRDGDGVAYMGGKSGYAMAMVLDPARVISGDPCWGFSHEVGHVHQTRPKLSWGGLGEVSNNIYSLYVTTSFGNKSRISEQGNYAKARASIIDKKISYLQDPDVFNRLVPFWQLQLYYAGPGKKADFYSNLFETFRQQEAKENPWNRERNPAVHQLNFVKTACEVAKEDLTDFFDQYGFFYVGEFEMDDYGKYDYRMTQAMVDKCKADIKALNLPKPKGDISAMKD